MVRLRQTGTTSGDVQPPNSSVSVIHISVRILFKPAGPVRGDLCPKLVRVRRRKKHGKSGQQHWGSSN
jgi:hypothetical protein